MKKTMLPTLLLFAVLSSITIASPAVAQLGLFSSSLKKGEVYRALNVPSTDNPSNPVTNK